VEVDYAMVDASQVITLKLDIHLKTMENNHQELKSMQNQLVQNQNQMLNKIVIENGFKKKMNMNLHSVHIVNTNGCCYQNQLHQQLKTIKKL
jgi:ribosomal protein L16 Arg81 hydroxylase